MKEIHRSQQDVKRIRVSGAEELRGRSEIAYVKQVSFWCQSRVDYAGDMRMPQAAEPREEFHETRTIIREGALADRLDDNVVPAQDVVGCNKR
jgi:hypothetical protein